MTTAPWPASMWTLTWGLVLRLLALMPPPSQKKVRSTQAPQTGTAWGRPSGRTVTTQKSLAFWSFSSGQRQGRRSSGGVGGGPGVVWADAVGGGAWGGVVGAAAGGLRGGEWGASGGAAAV